MAPVAILQDGDELLSGSEHRRTQVSACRNLPRLNPHQYDFIDTRSKIVKQVVQRQHMRAYTGIDDSGFGNDSKGPRLFPKVSSIDDDEHPRHLASNHAGEIFWSRATVQSEPAGFGKMPRHPIPDPIIASERIADAQQNTLDSAHCPGL